MEIDVMRKIMDLTGQKYAKLTVLERAPNFKDKTSWHCICECGNTTIARGYHLRNKSTRSCGCLRVGQKTHNGSGSSEYGTWSAMIQRITNPENVAYHNYGGRGLTVCDQWRTFEGFIKDMGQRPKGYTIDRIDNDKGYSPENCKWATPKEQSRNTRKNVHITIDGVTKILIDWLINSPFCRDTYYRRKKRGFSDRDALGL